MWLNNLGPVLSGLAAIIVAFTPLLAVLRRKDGTPLLPLPGDPMGWARAATWAAGVAFAVAFAVIIYGLAATSPVMSSTPVVRIRLGVALMGLLSVSAGAWSVVTGWHQDPRGYQAVRIGAATSVSGFLVLAGMLVIALPGEAPGVSFQGKPTINGVVRAFEIVMARRMEHGELETQWFARHRSTPVTEIPKEWPEEYRRAVERRIEVIESNRNIGLIERPSASAAGSPSRGRSGRPGGSPRGSWTGARSAPCGRTATSRGR